MGARPNIFEDLRCVGALKRDLLNREPSDNALGRHTDVQASRDTVGAWLRGERFPRQVEPLLALLSQIRAEAARRGLLDAPAGSAQYCTVSELLDPDRWRASWQGEQHRRVQANQDAAQRQRAHAALEEDERRARQAALADRPRPVGSWSAQRLGVHAAIPGQAARAQSGFALPRYVPRPHDAKLRTSLAAAAAEGARPQMVVVRGASCTGKTRTAYEAVRTAVPGDFDLLFPADAEGLLAVLAADALGPRTVLWLNEAQEYLDTSKGEAVAAALLRRLDAAGPLIVVATLWPDHDQTLTRRPSSDADDHHPKARDLLAQAHYAYVPDSFTGHMDAVRAAARDDGSLAAAAQTGGAGLTQILAAGPDLVEHYEHPVGGHGLYGRALISAAMDAHRLGAAAPLPLDFLRAAAPGYLTDTERAAASPDWFTGALAYARTRVKDTTRPFQEVPRPSGMGALPGVVRLADFLQQHGRRTRRPWCPPASFWDAATAHLTDPNDLFSLGEAAHKRSRHRHTAHLYCAAVDAGSILAVREWAWMREEAGDHENAERFALRAADAGSTSELMDFALMRGQAGDHQGAERLLRQAADAGDTEAPAKLARMREEAGDREGAERLLRHFADAGNTGALTELARIREEAGDREGAERLLRQAADAGNILAVKELTRIREAAGDHESAERFALRASDAGATYTLKDLAKLREETGDHESAERFALRAHEAGNPSALSDLIEMREKAGDHQGAERLVRQAADAGFGNCWGFLAELREKAGDHQGAERLLRHFVEPGDTYTLEKLTRLREEAGDREGAERLLRHFADAGNTSALTGLARMREEAGDREGAERLLRQAADAGNISALANLIRLREEAGDREGAERFALRAYDVRNAHPLLCLAKLRKKAGDREGAERFALHIVDTGNARALMKLAELRKKAGDREGAERFALHIVDTGNAYGFVFDALVFLAELREEAGDRKGAEPFALRALNSGESDDWEPDVGGPFALTDLARLRGVSSETYERYGLDADGTLAEPWEWPEPRAL
ncbi:tetratricopeptide repeat protein [Nocardiopsis tropica]|uniref:Uncharacterized protein n=1 Tax=Nocardiopsis tropica TaxID=109330 RepID=A0ABV2A2C0_9ACTN